MNMELRLVGHEDDQHNSVIGKIKHLLEEIETTPPPPLPATHSALMGVSNQLLALRDKGFSSEWLVLALSQCDINVSMDELNNILRQALLARMRAYEEKVEISLRRCHVKASARTEFIERGLRNAMKSGEGLQLHYQPQVDMRTGSIIGAEALLRWRNGSEFVSPVEFIPVAEESGLIEDIGAWVLREACTEAKRWERMGLGGHGKGIKVSVNLSVKQFSDRLVGDIHGVLCDVGLSTKLLGVEITESFLAENNSQHLLQTLHDTGLHISIDDFGTGYSCLSRVSALPLDTIKIDRAFIIELGRSPGAGAVVQTLISMAHKLGMNTIAEGVETQQQAEVLQRLGCTLAQGYLYAKPLPASEFISFAKGAPAGPAKQANSLCA
ncbi:putative bifunctional diguanylate cyclase/phosphodiesterase [Acidovorax carolinensis]|nr:EAL domain-containing protein [Acidovorax carolinensis]